MTTQTRRTYLGIPATTWEFTGPADRRVSVVRWEQDNPNTGHQAGDLYMKDCEGDGRDGTLVVHDKRVIPNGTDADAAAYAAERLGTCGHLDSTLVETRGLGGFNPVEVYACDACGHRSEIRLMHEAEDCGFAPEEDES